MSDNNKIIPGKQPTLITTGSGANKTIVSGGVQSTSIVTSNTGKVIGQEKRVDVVYVFDTTGSMDDKIEGLKRVVSQFVDEATSLGLDLHQALVSFGDLIGGYGDKIQTEVSLSADVEALKRGLRNIHRNNGFGNSGESSLEAIQHALKLPYRESTVKVLVLITDEPALQHDLKADQITQLLGQREFLVFCVTINEQYYRDMASKNGGIWKEISATSNLNEILEAFRTMIQKIAKVATEVYKLGHGSVGEYLRLMDKN